MPNLGRIVGRLSVVLLLAVIAACASSTREAARTGGAVAYSQVGLASWYGKPFHGRRTASGERYDMHALTAAHRTLAFGTRVRVVNLENGKTVVVRINDRGPFVKGRIVDLSRRAADQLAFIEDGVVKVRVEVLKPAGS